jgi:hypothetical protein
VAGLPLEHYYPELAGHYLLCAPKPSQPQDMDLLVEGGDSHENPCQAPPA